MPSKLPMIGVRVKPTLYARLRVLARADARSVSNFVARHLAEHFNGGASSKRRHSKKDFTQPSA